MAMAKSKSQLRARRTVEELQRASLAVQYELCGLAQFHHMIQELNASGESDARAKALSNALLHAFLLAARNLLAFLYAHNPRPTDIISEDFFDDPNIWRAKRPVAEPELANGELVEQISKRLAHLTWDRAQTTKPLWGPFKIVWNISTVIREFLELVEPAKIHPQLREDFEIVLVNLKTEVDRWGCDPALMAPHKEFIEFDELVYFESESNFED